MSSNKHYLRVANSWLQIFTPSGNDRYMSNASGITIRLLLSDTSIDPATINDDAVRYFTVGGTIGSLHANNTKYVYARAVTDSATTQGILACDTEAINNDDIIAIRDEIETISVEIMKLMKRVSIQERKRIDHGVDYELFVREFLDTTARHHIQFSAIHKHIATIWEELLLAEKFIQNHRMEYTALKEMVENIRNINNNNLAAEIALLKADVTSLLANHANVVNTLADLRTMVNNTDTKCDHILTDEVNPMKSKLIELMNNFAALNNSLILFADKYSVDDINNAFDDFAIMVPPAMTETVAAIKDYALRIVGAETRPTGGLDPNNVYLLNTDNTTVNELGS